MIEVTFPEGSFTVESSVAQALYDDGTIDRVRTDSAEYYLSSDLALALFNQGLLREDAGACGRGWLGTKGNCKRKPSAEDQPAGLTRGQKIRRVGAVVGGLALAGAGTYALSKRSASPASSKYASTRVPQGVQGGPLALSNKGSGQMARTTQIKKEIKKSMFRTRAERKLAKASQGVKNSSTFFSARSGSGKGRLSETIGNIPEGTSTREARRVKKRPQWLTPGYKPGKGG